MKTLDLLKVILVLVALAIWAFGVRTGRNGLVIVGVVFMLVAFLLRFVGRSRGGQ